MFVGIQQNLILHLTRSLRFWKYTFLLVLLVISVLVSTYDLQKQAFVYRDAALNFTQGVLASIIFSLVYDFFTRREQNTEMRLLSEELTERLASKIIDA